MRILKKPVTEEVNHGEGESSKSKLTLLLKILQVKVALPSDFTKCEAN